MLNEVKNIKKNKGFTLVELLVVIIIIGILAGNLVMSVTSIQEEAEFAKIVSDLRSMKAAARLYYAEEGIPLLGNNPQNFLPGGNFFGIGKSIDKYMDNKVEQGHQVKKYYFDGDVCVRFYQQNGTDVPKAVIGGIEYAKLPKGLQKRFDSRTKDIGFKNSHGGPWGEATDVSSPSNHKHIYLQLY